MPTWPPGAHTPVADGVHLSAPAAARRMVHLLEVLDLTEATLVANDTGGGLTLGAVGDPTLDQSRRPLKTLPGR